MSDDTNGTSRPTCGARTRDGGHCGNLPLEDRSRCRMHGGESLRGPRVNTFKDGMRSRVLPTRLLDRYQAALDDNTLLSLREDVALITTLLDDKLERWADSGSDPDWQDVFAQIDLIKTSFRSWEWERAEQELQLLVDRVQARRSEGVILDEVRSLIDQRAKLATQEHRRLIDLDQVLTVEQVVTIAAALAAVVREIVPDQRVHGQLEDGFARVLSIQATALR